MQAQKDARRLAQAGLRPNAERLLIILARDPCEKPPPFEKLLGDLKGAHSRRINIQHRLVHQAQHPGSKWLDSKESIALEFPSVVIPQERNLLLNPAHP